MKFLCLILHAVRPRGITPRRAVAGALMLAGLVLACAGTPAAALPAALAAPASADSAPATTSAAGVSSDAATPHARLSLRSERGSVAPGDRFRLALMLTSIPHWHTYWRNPGDTGLPTRVRWELPAGVTAGDIEWPLPQRLPTPPLMSFGYEGTATLLVPVTVAANVVGPLHLVAHVRWLVCAEQCVPESADVALDMPVGTASPGPDAGLIASAVARLPRAASAWTLAASSDGRWLRIDGSVPAGQSPPARLWLFPERKDSIVPAAAQPYHVDGRSFALAVPLPAPGAGGGAGPSATPEQAAALGTLAGLLVADGPDGAAQGWSFTTPVSLRAQVLPPADGPSGASGSVGYQGGAGGLLLAMGLALIGGLLLNLMPCVLPVLSLKVFALVGEAGAPRGVLLRQGLSFLAGVMVSFWLLAGLLLVLKSLGASLGWGFQLQSPQFVLLLAVLFTLLALNFAGVFELGTGLQAAAGDLEQRTGGHGGTLASFSSGVLTTLVATPCTGPFLGAGIGFTLDRPAAEALLVFSAMGLGVGLPVTLLAAFPAWLRRVPRPGPWMLVLKQLFAFPMLATVVWLVWVLGHQRGVDAVGLLLLGLILVGLAAWLWGLAQQIGVRTPGLRAQGLQWLAAACVAGGLWCAWPAAGTAADASGLAGTVRSGPADLRGELWEAYSDRRLAELRAQGRPAFVDFTAAWCLSCQVNKRTTLRTAAVAARMRELGVVALEADWTNADPEITGALARLHRNAVPVYAVYPRDGGEPAVLPEVLTQSLVLGALERAARPAGQGASARASLAREAAPPDTPR